MQHAVFSCLQCRHAKIWGTGGAVRDKMGHFSRNRAGCHCDLWQSLGRSWLALRLSGSAVNACGLVSRQCPTGKEKGSSREAKPLFCFGWGTWIRTTINGVRVRRPTIERFPSRRCLKTRPSDHHRFGRTRL